MRIFITGGSGFIGRHVVARLLDRGDEVMLAVRDPASASGLGGRAVDGVRSDLSDAAALTEQIRGSDAVIHAAGQYRVGIPATEREAMWDANVGTTQRVLSAAVAAGVGRIVYVSTVNVFGNTRGRVVDESYRRDPADGFVSWYDETKFRAHEEAERRIAAGAPIVIVMPSQVYGPGDHSAFGDQLQQASRGDLRYRALEDVRIGLVHVEDLAAGIVAALDTGRVGESYVLSGPTATLGEAVTLAAATGARRAPRLRVPTRLLRALAPLGRLIGQRNLREVISASDGVTYLASADKAVKELGFRPRDLDAGFADAFGGP
jgi:nucleoside-diphosphate-sugar epimerase